MAWEELGQSFVKIYYQTFDSNRDGVLQLYHSTAMMTFEDTRVQGIDSIRETLATKLKFNTIQHLITKVDCQPTLEDGVIILVTGRLKTDEDHPHAFSQTFYVRPTDGNYFIYHDIFRLSLHNM